MIKFMLVFFVIFSLNLHATNSQISNKRLCANEDCTEPISLGKTLIRYPSPDHRMLSFKPNAAVTIFSKSAGSNMGMWGAEIDGKRGYINKDHVRETKILTSALPYLVDTELVHKLDNKKVPLSDSGVKENFVPNKVHEAYEVVDGTTLFLNTEEPIAPSVTESAVQPTLAPKLSEAGTELTLNGSREPQVAEASRETEALDVAVLGDSNKVSATADVNGIDYGETAKEESLVDNMMSSITNWMTDGGKKRSEQNDIADGGKKENEENDIDVHEEQDENDDADYDDFDDADSNDDDEADDDEDEEDVSKEVDINEKPGDKHENKDKEQIIEQETDTETVPINIAALLSKKNDVNPSVDNQKEQQIFDGLERNEKGGRNLENPSEENHPKSELPGEEEIVPAEDVVKLRNLLSDSREQTDDGYVKEIVVGSKVEEGDFGGGSKLEVKVGDAAAGPKIEGKEDVLVTDAVGTAKLEDVAVESNYSTENQNQPEPALLDEKHTEDIVSAANVLSASSIQHNDIIKRAENPQVLNSDDLLEDKQQKITRAPVLTENPYQDVPLIPYHSNIEEVTPKIMEYPTTEVPVVTENPYQEVPMVPHDTNIALPTSENPSNPNEPDISTSTETQVNAQDTYNQSNVTAGAYVEELASAPVDENIEVQSPQSVDELTAQIPIEAEQFGQESVNGIQSSNGVNSVGQERVGETLNSSGVLPEIYTGPFGDTEGEKELEGKQEGGEGIQEAGENIQEGNEESQEDGKTNREVGDEKQGGSEGDVDGKQDNLGEEVFSWSPVGAAREHGPEGYESVLMSTNHEDHENCPADSSDCPYDLPRDETTLDTEETPQSDPQPEMDEVSENLNVPDVLNLLTVLGVTGLSVVVFLLGYVMIDKSRKEGPLIAKINNLEKSLLIAMKENQLLTDRIAEIHNEVVEEGHRVSNEAYESLRLHLEEALSSKTALEEQLQGLEKELEYSTEVGLELNKMLSDILSSQNGSDILIANVEQLQRQLVEQQGTINSVNATLNLKDTENHELQLELEINNKKVTDLQAELDKMVLNMLKIEEEKEQLQTKLESEVATLKAHLEKLSASSDLEKRKLVEEIKLVKADIAEARRSLDLKNNEYALLKDSVNQVKAVKNNTEALKCLLDVASAKAELQQLHRDNQALTDLLHQEQQTKYAFEKQTEVAIQETQRLKARYDEADKEKLEAITKLEVLSNYFKDREAQLQKELTKQESMWVERQGEATSTIERIKYMQEELQNYKAQNESLKQEIVSQEVELKSQISVLEKKAHESWVTARQAERKLEDARQEAAQLRNRLTLKERSFIEDKRPKRILSPLEQNGELPTSPLHMQVESSVSPPPLLYGARDRLTTSPPIPGLPPFLPPPPGVPFMPPPIPGVPGFMPPPPSMFSVDHRPPPLGRMSSPPINSRYSPDSRYSPYDRNSPSPPYDDDYGSALAPHAHRAYSPNNNRDDRRDYKRPPPLRSNGRNKGALSSGSANSNESLEKINRHHSKV